MNTNILIEGDCIEKMKDIPDNSIDCIFCDLPYNMTPYKWDQDIIPLDKLWEQYKRITKDNSPIILTASQPFTSKLVSSNYKMFRCEWIWEKHQGTNPALCNHHPMKIHEEVLIFSKKPVKYYPQMIKRDKAIIVNRKLDINANYINANYINANSRNNNCKLFRSEYTHRFPNSIQKINNVNSLHKIYPTEKPIDLIEYFLKTYTVEGDIVLDNCCGSGSTAIACMNLNRKYILIEKSQEAIDITKNRILEYNNTILDI